MSDEILRPHGDMNPWALEILREIDPNSLPKDSREK